ncbi:MAG: biotin/lipoyl-containing protein [Candidatus Faecivicinus sp.]
MKKNLVMPRLREEMRSGVLCAWLKEEGEAYQKGEPIFEIETDKVVNQVEAAADGVMLRQLVEEGDEVPAEAAVAEVEE